MTTESRPAPQTIFAGHLKAHRLAYPDDRLVALFARHFSDLEYNRSRKGLDIGCGGGRHLALLEDFGFQVCGIDYTPEAVDTTRSTLMPRSACWDLQVTELLSAQWAANSFTAVVAWGVLFLKHRAEVVADLRHIRASLASDGLLFANFRGKENWLYGLGEEVEPGTFQLDARAMEYNGLLYNFMDLQDIEAVASEAGFEIVERERIDLWKRELSEHHTWWIVALKPREV